MKASVLHVIGLGLLVTLLPLQAQEAEQQQSSEPEPAEPAAAVPIEQKDTVETVPVQSPPEGTASHADRHQQAAITLPTGEGAIGATPWLGCFHPKVVGARPAASPTFVCEKHRRRHFMNAIRFGVDRILVAVASLTRLSLLDPDFGHFHGAAAVRAVWRPLHPHA